MMGSLIVQRQKVEGRMKKQKLKNQRYKTLRAPRTRREIFPRARPSLFWQFRTRQINGERRAFAHAGVNVQRSIGFLDQPLDDVQSQAGALARPLGGEVRSEERRVGKECRAR